MNLQNECLRDISLFRQFSDVTTLSFLLVFLFININDLDWGKQYKLYLRIIHMKSALFILFSIEAEFPLRKSLYTFKRASTS